jgi:hypothetical protein
LKTPSSGRKLELGGPVIRWLLAYWPAQSGRQIGGEQPLTSMKLATNGKADIPERSAPGALNSGLAYWAACQKTTMTRFDVRPLQPQYDGVQYHVHQRTQR